MKFYYDTLIGRIGIEEENGWLTRVFLPTDPVIPGEELYETPLIKQAIEQLERYLHGNLQEFTLPLRPEGTVFMKKVWQKLCEVPYGQTASYKDIAASLGNSKASRAIGLANHRNPIPILIPCHRVIGSNGELKGYRGGMELKKRLLDIETE